LGRLRELHDGLRGRVQFLMVYIREAHGGGGDPAEGRALIRTRLRELALPFRCVLDGAGAEAEAAFQAWPLRLVVLAPDGRLAYDAGVGLAGWDLDAVRSWLEAHAHPPALGRAQGAGWTVR
jgi:Iodothyronine deiodinase